MWEYQCDNIAYKDVCVSACYYNKHIQPSQHDNNIHQISRKPSNPWSSIFVGMTHTVTSQNKTLYNKSKWKLLSCNMIWSSQGSYGIPWPSSFIIYQLSKFASSLFHKTTANLLYICQVYPNKFSPILTIKAAKRPVCFLSTKPETKWWWCLQTPLKCMEK